MKTSAIESYVTHGCLLQTRLMSDWTVCTKVVVRKIIKQVEKDKLWLIRAVNGSFLCGK